ncbi:hypothetical protein AJ90_19150 [Vibrio parahaemolyticus M0605]|nr:hypothetical protein AJ90_19150 [Vibrio parahaemolyticus M0605]
MVSETPLLQVNDISLAFGGVKALTDVSFHVNEKEIFSIIGPNGAGKTSMLNCISGRYTPNKGSVIFAGNDVTKRTPSQRAELGLAEPSKT